MPGHLAEMLAPIAALGTAAEAAPQLRIGTIVLNNDFRHPVLVAREAAAVDVLSDGRLGLGLGAGHMKSEYDQAGLRFYPGEVRVARLAEALVIVKRLLDGETVTVAGTPLPGDGHYPSASRPAAAAADLRRRQRPRVLRLAAREADIVGCTGINFMRGDVEPEVSAFRPASIDAQVRVVREAAGERFGRLELSALLQRVIVTDDCCRRRAAQRWPQLRTDELLESPYLLIGTVDGMAEQPQRWRERWGFSYLVTHEAYADALAPAVARSPDAEQYPSGATQLVDVRLLEAEQLGDLKEPLRAARARPARECHRKRAERVYRTVTERSPTAHRGA